MNDILILASLLSGPKHGYLIKKEAGLVLTGHDLHNNLVYPLLHRFRLRGWVGQRKSRGERGQTRLEYYLKAAGRAEISRRVKRYPDSGNSDEAFYLRAGLFDLLDSEARSRILRVRESELENLAARLKKIAADLKPTGFASEMVNYLRHKTKAELNWVRSLDSVKKRTTKRAVSRLNTAGNTQARQSVAGQKRGAA
jgi:DNA-binding PadR family transcriptional regulator